MDKVIVGTATWSELFAKHDFFHKYRYYLQVIASTGDADLQIKWYDLAIRITILFDAIAPGLEQWSLEYDNWS